MRPKETTVILVVDDEKPIRDLITRVLFLSGYTNIIVAQDGAEGQKMIEHRNPDLVICDLTMPGMRGEVLISWAKQNFPETIILAISGDGGHQVEQVVRQAGADAFLPKPFTVQNFAREVEALLVASRE